MNGFTTTYDYDLLNRLIKQETVDIDGNVVVQYIYRLGTAGERLGVTELNRSVEYTYDSLYRLSGETITEGEKVTAYTYAYDNVSNRILKNENGAEIAYVYNALNQLVSDSETSYEYDLNGNLVRVIGSAQSALYEYNAENKLVRATVQNGVLVTEETYTYDYSGNRTSKTTHRSDGVTEYVKYLNDNSSLTNVLAEIGSEGSVQAYYTIGADLISQERDGKVSVYLYDGHGSVVGLANENGKVTDTYAYDAFGNLLKSTGSTKNHYCYCGEQFDPVTGLYYLRARYMNPSVGRFITMDSYEGSIDDPVSLHKYLYANANPVSNSDPSGYKNVMEFQVTTGIQGIINKIAMPNPKALLDMVGGIFDVVKDTASSVAEGIGMGLEGPKLAMHIATGFLTSLVTNFSCMLTKLGPIGYVLMGIAAVVIGVVAVIAFAEGNTEMGLAQVANIVSIIFSMFNPTCFSGDTEVYTSDGLVCIEDVQVGDEVWAYNSETGETELKEVLNVWVKETDEILHVSTSDGETIDTTTNHPFYVEEKGWVAAGDLKIGDVLVTAVGKKVEVTDLELEKLAEPILVYNLDVADFDTYFVGEYGVLVHNYSERHHIASDKSIKSGYTKEYKDIFDKAGIDFDNPLNIIDLENHKGRHTNAYKDDVLQRLQKAVRKVEADGKIHTKDEYYKEFKKVLLELKELLLKGPKYPYK